MVDTHVMQVDRIESRTRQRVGVRLRLSASVEGVPYARAAVTRLCEHLGFADELIGRVRLTVTEACTNCVRHAYGSAGRETYVLDAHLEQSRLRVVVRDRGVGFNQKAQPELCNGASGLRLMQPLPDDVTITSRPGLGTEVVMDYDVAVS